MAQCVARVNRPTLVMAHNKTLAAQLYQEFRRFFPENAVEYFVSYYDYYQPEAYVPTTDSYIEKEATINDEIDRMRLSATRSLFERRDVIIVASVSCIYGLGSPEAYYGMMLPLERGQRIERDQILRKLVEIQYERNDYEFNRGVFRVRGDIVEVYPSYEDQALRIELFGDEVDELVTFDPLTGKTHPAATTRSRSTRRRTSSPPAIGPRQAVETIKAELTWRRETLESEGKVLEAHRLHQRTMFDLEMIKEIGYCHGIENYARHLTGRAPGEPPPTLLDYLPDDALVIVDESHQTRAAGARDVPRRPVPQGSPGRVRLPPAVGARQPAVELRGVGKRVGQLLFVSATPGPYELRHSGGEVVEQIIRPTGLVDPIIEVRPVRGQVDDLLGEIRDRAARSERVLVTTLTKRMAEDLTQYYQELGRQGPVSALRHRYAGAHPDPARSAARRVRRAGRHQPAARGIGSAGSVARRDSRCRQGGLPAVGRLADSDRRPRGPQRERPRHHVRRRDDRVDALRDQRDRPPAHDAGSVQPRARHHARVDRQKHRRGDEQCV